MNYAQAANGIVNKPVTTSYLNAGSASMASSKSSVGRKNEAGAVEHWHEMECRLEYMKSQVEEAQQALARKHLQQQQLIEQVEKAEEARVKAEYQYDEAKQANTALRVEINEHVRQKECLTTELSNAQQVLKETNAVLEATQKTESSLTQEARLLIHALKQSIQDGQDLYRQLIVKRDEDVQRKDATNTFNNDLLSIVHDISKSIDAIGDQQKEFSQTVCKSTKLASEELQELVQGHQVLIDGLYHHVQATAAILRNNIEDGILPTMKSTSSTIQDHLKEVNNVWKKSEVEITDSCRQIQKKLDTSSNLMSELQTVHNNGYTEVLDLISAKIFETNTRLEKLVSSAAESLTRMRSERSESTETIRNLLADWRSSSNQQTGYIVEHASRQASQVVDGLETLNTGRKRLDEIDNHLSSQHTFVKEQEVQHLDSVRNQSELLLSQRQEFDVSQQKNKEFCEQFMSNVMAGLQDVLNDQMASMLAKNKETYETFISGNEALMKGNVGVHGSAKDILSTIAKTNRDLNNNFVAVKETESKLESVLNDTHGVLEGINECGVKHASMVEENADGATKMILEAEESDGNRFDQLYQGIESDSTACGAFMSTEVQDSVKKSIHGLKKSSDSAFSYVKADVIESSKNGIASSVEQPFGTLFLDSTKILNSINQDLRQGEEKIREQGQVHCQLVESMDAHVDSELTKSRSLLGKELDVVEQRDAAFNSTLGKQENVLMGNLSKIERQMQTCENTVDSYAHDVIKINIVPSEIAKQSIPQFSEDLSSTPAQSEIIKTLYKENEDPVERTTDVSDDVYKESNADSDEAERTSSSPLAVLQETNQNETKAEKSQEALKRQMTTRRHGSRLKKPRTRI